MKILIAVDGSAGGDAAVNEIGRRPWPEETEIRLIHVFTPWRNEFSRGNAATAYDDLNKQLQAAGVQCLREAQARLQRLAPGIVVDTVLREGSAKQAILQEAESWGVDLIALGSTGRGAVERLFLGSTSLAIATGAPCSVEIIRTPPPSPLDLQDA